METDLMLFRLGNYSMQQANDDVHCEICGEPKFATVLVRTKHEYIMNIIYEDEFICIDCLLQHYETTKGLMTAMPCHVAYSDNNCCGIFNKIKDNRLVCNECEMTIDDLIKSEAT